MSRKKRVLIESRGINPESGAQNAAPNKTAPPESWWSKLGKFERLGIVALGLFLVAGILGATGLGNKVLNTFAGDSAGHQVSRNNSSSSAFSPATATSATPQLSKEYIYAGSRLLAVEDANATAVPPVDLAVWRPANGVWYVAAADGSLQAAVAFGQNGDIPLPGDYDGDGKTDFCVYRPSNFTWYVLPSSTNVFWGQPFGAGDDEPAPADYDGDGRTDLAVYRPGERKWYIRRSSDLTVMTAIWGVDLTTDQLAPADYDGDGRAEIAVWRQSAQSFYALLSSLNYSADYYQTVTLSAASTTDSEPVSADYDGDGRADYAVRSGGSWLIRQSSNNQLRTETFGFWSDRAVANDYDGDGKVDVAVWRGSTGGHWFILQSSRVNQPDYMRAAQWGQAGDIPVPVFYRR